VQQDADLIIDEQTRRENLQKQSISQSINQNTFL